MPKPLCIVGMAVDFTAARDGAQINLSIAADGTEPAYVLSIPMLPDAAAQVGGMLLALAGALKASPPSQIIAARGLSLVPPNGSTH